MLVLCFDGSGGKRMAKNNADFFKEKKAWSEIKDSLLGCYLKPYVQKVISTRRPVLYIDCFAGKGCFDDGKHGSPVIALNIINECLSNTNLDFVNIRSFFIEKNYAQELEKNLLAYKNTLVIKGKYEDHIESVLKEKTDHNLFMYIDPYGIKALQFTLFESIARMNFRSVELLMNMNSFGFVREACHALGANFDIDVSEDIIEYEPTTFNSSDKAIEALNSIAGGDYWIKIINDYMQKKIDGYQTEILFTEEYCKRLNCVYRYVLNMPIRLKKGQRPKYRMIHATNHEDGCILMNDNICKRWEAWQDIQNNGQMYLFPEDIENKAFDEFEIRNDLLKMLVDIYQFTNINTFISEFVSKFGVRCSTSFIKDQLKLLENEKKIEVRRFPPKTAKTGKTSAFWDCKGGKLVQIKGLT